MSTPCTQPTAGDPLGVHPADLTASNTFGLAARARACLRLTDASMLPRLADAATRFGAMQVLGGGSNVILPPQVDGLVVQMAMRGIRLLARRDDALIVEAAGGEPWHGFVQTCLEQGWHGLENLALIPGTVGAAPVQNIGAYGVEMNQRFDSLLAWDMQAGRLVELHAAECGFAYRDSRFKHDAPGRWVITAVRFRLPLPWRPVLDYPDLRNLPLPKEGAQADTARAIFDAVCSIRRAKLPDPAVTGNAGSFFKNPLVSAEAHRHLLAVNPGLVAYAQADGRYKLAAGWLIDQCGWKGRTLGAAGVHERQALVLVNRGGAQASDILRLAAAIQDDVQRRFGVLLEREPVLFEAGPG